jgi:porin
VDGNVEAGLNVSGLVSGRPDDAFELALTYSHISDAAAALDRDAVASGAPTPIKDFELLLELTYLDQIAPGWSVQPDLQYIWHAGGIVQNVNAAPGTAIDDTLVLGLPTKINY